MTRSGNSHYSLPRSRRDEEAKLVILGRVGRLLPKPDKGFSFALFHAVFSVLGIVLRGWAAPTPPVVGLFEDVEERAVCVHTRSRSQNLNVSLESFRCADPFGDSVWCPRSMTVNP